MAAPKKYPDELRKRAVRLYRESDPKPSFRWLAEQLNVPHEALRHWVRQAEADDGQRHDRPTTDMLAENRRLARHTLTCTPIREEPVNVGVDLGGQAWPESNKSLRRPSLLVHLIGDARGRQ